MTDGLVVHQALCAAATLGIADLLNAGRTVGGGSSRRRFTSMRTRSIGRCAFCRARAIFREIGSRTFVNTPLSDYLRSDVPGSMRPVLMFRGSRYYFAPFTEFLSSLQTGIPAREKVLGSGAFEYLRADPEAERVFDEAMTAISAAVRLGDRRDLRVRTWETVTDVGGGNGALLAAILRAHPSLHGVLADAPSVVERSRRARVPLGRSRGPNAFRDL